MLELVDKEPGDRDGSGGLAGFEQGYHVLAGVRAGASPLLMTSQHSTLGGRNGGVLVHDCPGERLVLVLGPEVHPFGLLVPMRFILPMGLLRRL